MNVYYWRTQAGAEGDEHGSPSRLTLPPHNETGHTVNGID